MTGCLGGWPAVGGGRADEETCGSLIAAGPLFFVSAGLLMLFAGVVGTDVGIRPLGYLTSMVVTIGLWLTLAPAIGAAGRAPGKGKG